MDSFKNETIKLVNIPDDRVAQMKQVASEKKTIFITILKNVPDIPEGSLLIEEREDLGGTVANIISTKVNTVTSPAIDVALDKLALEIKKLKKEEKPEVYYISTNLYQDQALLIALKVQAGLSHVIGDADILVEAKPEYQKVASSVFDATDDSDVEDKPKKKKKKKKKK
jgi:hypothetical protein